MQVEGLREDGREAKSGDLPEPDARGEEADASGEQPQKGEAHRGERDHPGVEVGEPTFEDAARCLEGVKDLGGVEVNAELVQL